MPVGTAGDGQGDAARKRARNRRRHHSGQHLSSDAAARRGAHRAAGRPAQIHGLGAADPHRLRRLSGDVAVGAAQDHRRGRALPVAYRRARANFSRPNARWKSSACWAPTSRWCWTNVPAFRRQRSGDRKIAGAFDALGDALQDRVRRAAGPRLFRHRAGRRIRRICARARREQLQEIGFDGYAVGGLAVGEGQAAMFDTLDATVPHLPADRPRYLMGVGKPDDIVGAVLRGIDMFDCVLPTRSGRNGQAFTWDGPLNLQECAPCRRSGAARSRLAAARPAGNSAAPICIMWSRRARSSPPCC